MLKRIAGGMSPEELVEFSVWVERQGGHVIKWLPLIRGVSYCLPENKPVLRTLRAGTWDEGDVRVYALGNVHSNGNDNAEARCGEPAWNLVAIQAPELWERTQGQGVQVAVIDTGVDMTHPGIPNIAPGYNVLEPGAPPQDDNGHGTHVAGIVAGKWEKGSGVAPQATIVPVKVLDAFGAGNLSDVADGMNWCLQQGIPIINLSLGTPQGTESMRAAVEAMDAAGLLVVAAAGNEGPRMNTVSYPAAWEQAVAVAASTERDGIANFSSRGPQVDIAAPGQSIVSTWPGGGTRSLSGTSMAAPHVSGGAALLWSLVTSRGERIQPRNLREPMLATCRQLTGYTPEAQGRGLLQVASAAQRLV